MITIIFAGISCAIFPLFINGVAAQPPIQVGDGPSGIAYNPDSKKLYVSNTADDTVSVIDTTTNTVVGNPIPVGDGPSRIAYDNATKNMYVIQFLDKSVSVIDTISNLVVGTIPVGFQPSAIAYDQENKRIYVTNLGDGTCLRN